MNFNVYLDDAAARRLADAARRTGIARNALVRQAVDQWLLGRERAWPPAVLAFRGMPEITPFEAHRAALAPPTDDPLAAPRPRRRSRR